MSPRTDEIDPTDETEPADEIRSSTLQRQQEFCREDGEKTNKQGGLEMRGIMACTLLCMALPSAAAQERPQLQLQTERIPLFFDNKPPRVLTQRDAYSMTDSSWILAPAPALEEIKVHDLVLVLVDERAVQLQQRQFQRQKQGVYNIELADWIRIDSKKRLANAAANAPTIDVNFENRLQTRGNQNVTESLTYRIAASVTSIRPNGNLIIGARKSIITNRDAWVYQLTGEINPKHIDAKDTVKSEYIANLQVIKHSTGKVRDSVKRGWMTRFLDYASPF